MSPVKATAPVGKLLLGTETTVHSGLLKVKTEEGWVAVRAPLQLYRCDCRAVDHRQSGLQPAIIVVDIVVDTFVVGTRYRVSATDGAAICETLGDDSDRRDAAHRLVWSADWGGKGRVRLLDALAATLILLVCHLTDAMCYTVRHL